MPTYMKAYLLRDLRRYEHWNEDKWTEWVRTRPEDDPSLSERLDDGDVVYLHEGGVVTRDVFGDGDVVFDAVTPEWLEFCRRELGFQVPDWEAESARVREEFSKVIQQVQEQQQQQQTETSD
jgi:hypothetical protein